jgi:hypothetical protein
MDTRRMDTRRSDQVPGSAEAPQIVKSTNEAREGVTGHNVRYVLFFGTAGVVLAFAVVYALTVGWH